MNPFRLAQENFGNENQNQEQGQIFGKCFSLAKCFPFKKKVALKFKNVSF
jgi:hypothetical protein